MENSDYRLPRATGHQYSTSSPGGLRHRPAARALYKATVIPVDVDELDITDRGPTINYILATSDTVINCAAFTNVDGCEDRPRRGA